MANISVRKTEGFGNDFWLFCSDDYWLKSPDEMWLISPDANNADGSGSYYGNDGSWGYRNSDGSSSFYGADGDSYYSDSNDNDSTSSSSSSGAEALGALLGFGLGAYAALKQKKDQERRKEEERRKQERIQREMKEAARRNKAKANREKRLSFYARHKKAILILFIVLFGIGFGYHKYAQTQKLIDVSINSEDLIGSDHVAVEKSLQGAGFTNIHDNIVGDLGIDEAEQEGVVTEISIHGDKEFSSSSRYPYDSYVDITYHVLKEINVPLSAKAAKKLVYSDLELQFKEMSFDTMSYDSFSYDRMCIDTLQVSVLRRGVIGVHEVGFIL